MADTPEPTVLNSDPNSSDPKSPTQPQGEDELTRVNKIVSVRLARELKPINAALTALQEMMGRFSPTTAPAAGDEEGETPGKDPAPGAKPDLAHARRISRLERELADERKARKEAEELRAAEGEKAKKNELLGLFQSALTEHGVTSPSLLRSAILLLDQEGVLVRDESGTPKFRGADKYGIETLFDPKTGIKTWLQGEGKAFLPAVDAGGSGSGPAKGGKGVTPANGRLTPQERARINVERACTGQAPVDEYGREITR